MIKKISDKDKKDWESFISSNEKIHNKDIFIKNKVRYKVKPIGTKTTIPAIKAFLNFEVIDDFFLINYKMNKLQNIMQL